MSNYQEQLEQYDRIVARIDGLQRKGKTMPYTSSNGYMFSQLNKAGEIGFRLSKEDSNEFLSTYDSGPFKSYGATMREYVIVPDEVLKNEELAAKWLNKGWEYVNGLPPK